jgi:hypothetical protein
MGIYLSVDQDITTGDLFLGRWSRQGLSAGSSRTSSRSLGIPTGLTPGTYYIGAVADYTGVVAESDETNNSLAGNTITIDGGLPPTADPGGPHTGGVGTVITFDGSASLDPDGFELTYDWDFGDGNTGTGPSPTHSYAALATYTVTLTVNDGVLDSSPATTTVSILAPSIMWGDGFESGDYAAGGWTRQNNGANVNTGAAYTGSYGAKLKGTTWIEKSMSTAGYVGIHVKYRRQTNGLDPGESIQIEWFDGSAWNSLETLQAASYAGGLQDKPCGSGADNNPDFAVRFRINADNNETAYVDDVEISGITQ